MRTQVSKDLLTEQKGAVLRLTLNRPEVLNALTAAMLEDLLRELERSEKDESVRCVVLRACGRAFCAGADLALLRELHASGEPLELGEELRRRFNPLIRLMRSMDKPVLAAVNGVAAGAGAGLALAPDIKIASENASFISVFIRVGLAPDSGMSHVLARGLGRSLALEHAWTAKPISAAQAAHFGLVNRVVPGERLDAEVERCGHPARSARRRTASPRCSRTRRVRATSGTAISEIGASGKAIGPSRRRSCGRT